MTFEQSGIPVVKVAKIPRVISILSLYQKMDQKLFAEQFYGQLMFLFLRETMTKMIEF